MARTGSGVELRENSIRIGFSWGGARCRETLEIPPTPANRKYAERLVDSIRQRIKLGNFDYAEFFPESSRVAAQVEAERAADLSFGQACDTWLQAKGRLADKTLNQYRNALGVWKGLLGAQTPVRLLTHGKVAAVVGGRAWASPKLLNNYLICLRGALKMAGRELQLTDNPMEGIENSRHQAKAPDPFSLEEMVDILSDMRQHHDERVWCYFAFAFAAGMRPEETIALRWSDVDWRTSTIRVERAKTSGKVKDLKTYHSRDVELTDLAIEALKKMKPWTYVATQAEGEIFQNPVMNRPWHDERSQRDHYWKPTLRRIGMRWRKPYNTRHTFATLSLQAGTNPTYVSRQMGHKSAQMLFNVYAKWIDGADRGRERSKFNSLLMANMAAKKEGT